MKSAGRKRRPTLIARVPVPLTGEHIAGYLRRLAQRNRLPGLRYTTRLLDVVDITPRSAGHVWDRLVESLDVRPSFVEPLRWREAPGGVRSWLRFFGHDVHDTYLHFQKMRICRGCVADTDTVLAIWSLRHLTACPSHGTKLAESCSRCGKQFKFHTYNGWTCTDCSTDFRDGADDPADECEVAVAASLIAAATGASISPATRSRFPRTWHRAPLQERLTTLEYLGQLSQLNEADHIPKYFKRQFRQIIIDAHRTTDDHRKTVLRAAEILSNWPAAYHELLGGLVDRNPNPTASAPLVRRFSTAAGLYAIQGLKDRDGGDLGLIGEARFNFLAKRIDYRRGGRDLLQPYAMWRRKEQTEPDSNLVSTAKARELVCNGEANLTVLTKGGLVTGVKQRSGILAWPRDKIEAIRAELASLPDPPANTSSLIPATDILKRPATRSYPHHFLLRDILSGTMPAYSTGPTLAETFLHPSHLEYLQSVHILGNWIAEGSYRELQFFNRHSTQVWGPMGHYKLRDAMQIVAAGELDYVDSRYLVNGWWRARRFKVADLVRHIQEFCHPHHFDLDDLEDPLRFEESAIW
jgi:ribosomal protein L37AE/L43A